MGEEDEGKELSPGERMEAAGWRQGALFSIGSAYICSNALAAPGSELLTEVKRRRLKSGERLVVISQTCDIVANVGEEPFVVAYVCKSVTSQRFLDNVEQNSARYFVVDPDTRLVAQAKYIVLIDKEALLNVTPEPWPSGDDRHYRFVRWLARRFDRPAVPDDLVAAFQNPVERALSDLGERQPEVRAAFSRAVHEVRVNLPGDEEPPYHLQLVLMAVRRELTQEEADGIDVVMSAIQSAVDTNLVRLEPLPWIVREDEIALGTYRRTRPLYLEYLTYEGDEVEGAEPSPRA